MEENIKEVKDKILEFADNENFSEAVKTFWAWKEKNPKITDSQSADLHILAAKSFVRYCKQNDSWDEMNKLFGGQKSSENAPENHSAAAEVENAISIDDVKEAIVNVPNSYGKLILESLKRMKSAVNAKNSKQKNESEKEEFIKSLEMIDCGNGWEISKPISDYWDFDGAKKYIEELNRKYGTNFVIPTDTILLRCIDKNLVNSDLENWLYHGKLPVNWDEDILCYDKNRKHFVMDKNGNEKQINNVYNKHHRLCLALKVR